MSWKSKIIGHGKVSPDQLTANPLNHRKHPQRQREALAASIREVGFIRSVTVNKRTGNLIDGHERVWQALENGEPEIDVEYVDLDENEERIALATMDRIAELAETDPQQLDALLRELETGEEALKQMLAEMAENAGLDFGAGEVEEPEVPEPPDNPVTQPGDLWILGEHRLLCGDSSKAEDVDRLLDGENIQLLNCDPPYNVRVEPRSNNAIAVGLSSFTNDPAARKLRSGQGNAAFDDARGKTKIGAEHHQKFDLARHPSKSKPTTKKMRAKDRPLENDFVSDEEFDRLLDAWFGNAARVLEPGRAFYIWGGYANCANYPPFLKKHGLYFSQAIIWDKQHPVLTRKDFMGAHEWCFYGWREGAAHRFFGPNNATDLWAVKKVNPQSMIHLTEKPVELAVRAIRYSSRIGENVLDLFGGSGSTLIACEQTDRKAFLMELDPPYCDVIVERFENFTGQKAKRIATKDEVAT